MNYFFLVNQKTYSPTNVVWIPNTGFFKLFLFRELKTVWPQYFESLINYIELNQCSPIPVWMTLSYLFLVNQNSMTSVVQIRIPYTVSCHVWCVFELDGKSSFWG